MQKLLFDLEVYTYQIDFAGHVNNSVYIHWMEIGRLKLLEAIGMPIHEVLKQGIAPILVETNIAYKLPLYLGDRVQAQMWLSELRHVSAVMQFRFYNSNQVLAAEGVQKGLFVDAKTMRPMRLAADVKASFSSYLNVAAEA
ncbi:acyl-CoA thioesterase [Phormidium tenue]|uniref:Thioesterase n=1 Tax=Phormidium tenue NIES-30 TaxID=549789 RepID=A0A1U7IZU5_9CYAN|nr:thioesterase family protein [Phormidium tenue]MBD2231702.1 acyl-CoA thioesterase [Phormidium tenue FACHB-1052]OKH44799.1 thioesterase [Phormidium tenue NIES-30]